MNLIIQYFRVTRNTKNENYKILKKRQEEYNFCLKKNIENNVVKSIHILFENDEDVKEFDELNLNSEKIVKFFLGKRLHFKDAFEYANKYLNNEIVIVLHSDIYLLSGFDKIKYKHLNNTMLALARTNNYDGKKTGRGIRIKKIDGKKYCATFDGYCFLTPVPKKIINVSDHQQNVWGSENKLIYNFKTNAYNVLTPNFLKMVHWHLTDIRPNQNENWITKDGELIPSNNGEFNKKFQKNNKKIIGGLIPIKLGTSLMIDKF